MPWTKDNPPKVALNWTADEQAKCVAAANSHIAKNPDDDGGAIRACVAAAGKAEQSSDVFFIPFSKALRDDILVFPVGKFHRDGQVRDFTKDMGAQMVANFRANILERKNDGWLPINAEHMRQHGRFGDIVALYQDESGNVRGKPHDPDGKLGGFDYFSPEVRWKWTHPTTGKAHQNVLMGGGATNYPFFGGKMALQNDQVAIAKSVDPPLVWNGSEWEVFSEHVSIVDKVRQTVVNALDNFAEGLRSVSDMPSHESVVLTDDMHALGFYDAGAEPQEAAFTHTVEFAASDADQRLMTGVVWEPDKLDMHGHAVTAEDIEAGAHDFMSRLQLDAHHDRLIQSDEVRIVESWIQREPVTWKMLLPDGGQRKTEVASGSWCMSVKVLDDELWNEVLSGAITGFSPMGVATAQELVKQNT